MDQPALAPLWRTSEWLNTPAPIDLEAQRGHVVAACAYQMLCPGCVAHVIPQMKAVLDLFGPQGVVVVGLHTVFEHHDAMTVTALRAFVHEYGIRFPVGVDRRASLKTLQMVAQRVGVYVTQRAIGKGISRWLPIVGAAGVGAYAYYDTGRVAATAIELFEKEITIEQ